MGRLLRRRATRATPAIAGLEVRPHWLERAGGDPAGAPSQRRWTVLGSLDGAHRARIDPRGLIDVDGPHGGWSLDWWIGAEDRWHVPAREAAVRQGLVGATPVVETRVRVPSGDAVQRAYGARTAGGAEVVVVEVENDTSVPFALALAVRPCTVDGLGTVRDVAVDGTEVHVGGRVAAVLDRPPRHAVAGAVEDRDPAAAVFAGSATGPPTAAASSTAGGASVVLLLPLAHRATLRLVVPLDEPAGPEAPDLRSVVAGWQAHARRGTRVEVPDRRLQAAADSSLRHLLLRAEGLDGLAALDRFGHPDAAAALAPVASAEGGDRPGAALAALAERWTAMEDEATAREVTPVAAALASRLGGRRGLDGLDRARGVRRLPLVAELLEAAGEPRAADDVRRSLGPGPRPPVDPGAAPPAGVAEAAVAGATGHPSAAATLRRARDELAAGQREAVLARLSWALGAASGTWTWPSAVPAGDPNGGLGDGHDPEANGALLLLVRELLVDDLGEGLVLSPVVPDAWLGQGWELHDAPTVHGRLSFAVRWHGDRPALLWELAPRAGRTVALRAPALDPSWSTTQPRGEALLAPVAIPERPARRGLTIPVSIEPSSGGGG